MKQALTKSILSVAATALLVGCGGSSSTPENLDTNTTPPAVQTPEENTTAEVNQTTPEADTLAPTITLKGDNPLTIAQGATFSDPGATATDNVDGSVSVSVSGSVDTATIGSYTLTYTAKDSAGNEARATRTVEVKDLTPPTFTSQASVSVQENQMAALTLQATDANPPISYAMSGGDSSAFDVNVTTGVVTFKSAPDFETQARYTFSASATDKYGNVATQEVNVTIIDVAEVQQLKKTGQTKSYDEDGNEVTDGSIKDDGFYQKGVDPSYTRDDTTEIVTDHITGLQWQDNNDTETVRKQWLTDENYDICDNNNSAPECYDTSGDTAATYCSNLTLGGYTDWRLPTIGELMSIVDRSKHHPAIDTMVFTHEGSGYYWSSMTFVGHEEYAWGVYFIDGSDDSYCKEDSNYVRCVRDGQP